MARRYRTDIKARGIRVGDQLLGSEVTEVIHPSKEVRAIQFTLADGRSLTRGPHQLISVLRKAEA